MKPYREPVLPICCPECKRTTHQPISKLQASVCICTGCGKTIKMTSESVAIVPAMK